MKTFRTTGTGNEQTLSEIETDKIPIYPSVQDIEDDFANLEEGQIVATPDTGNEVAQPVDVVEKDNLHAVTSNAVSESLSYSTTEQKTGGYWIDGKPIYRQIVPMYRNGSLLSGFTSVGSGRYTSTVTPRNMERIIINYANVLRQNNACDIITSSAGNSYGFSVYTTGEVYMNISVGSIKDIDIGLEYTKTTD